MLSEIMGGAKSSSSSAAAAVVPLTGLLSERRGARMPTMDVGMLLNPKRMYT